MPTKSAPPTRTADRERLDKLHPIIVRRAAKLGLSSYAIAQQCRDGKPNEITVRNFLMGRASMNSAYLSEVLRVLGWAGDLPWAKAE